MVAAQGSERKASVSEINTKSSEQASKLSETNARKSEESAASSAATATGQASSARTSASNASASEANAKASEKAASVSAANAKASADTASTQASASASSATSAKNSATSASQSASSASSSATSASNSASSAANSDASASDSRDKASEYKTSASGSATAAASSASSASTSATNAKAAMNTANTAASSASTSATSASTSASNASKSEVAAKSAQAEAERARDEANSALAKISGALKYMGQVDNYNDLPSAGNSKGDTWNVVNADPSHHIKAGDNVAWNGTEWDDLSGTVDLSIYAEKADYQKAITSAAANGATITFNHKDGTTSTATVNNVASATAATNDAKGQKIDATYEKIADASNVHASLQNSINTKLDKTGNAVSATKLQAARTLSLTGKAAGSATFDGSANASINVTSVNADSATKIVNNGDRNNLANGTKPPSGLSVYQCYAHAGYPQQYGNVVSIGGHGDNELFLGWQNDARLLYRAKRDTYNDWMNWRAIAFTDEINNYAPTKTGGGASGTWGINITGNAANDSNGANIANTYLKLDSFKSSLIASLPACYERSTMWSAAKNIITVPDYITVNIGNNGYVKTGASTIDVNTASNWDNSTYATSANRAGKDFYIYACQASGTVPKFVLSANSTVPTGYTATNSRKIGGFHCECADVGTINGHPLSGYIAGDILPRSIWDLKHRPVSSPEGMVWCDGVWVDIYLAGWDGSKLVSQYKAVIQDGDSTKKWHGELFNEEFHKIKKRLLWRDEFAAYAKGSNERTNIAGNSDPNTTGGHKDTTNRRMISNYGLEDCCGVLWQWTNDISMRGTVTNGTDSDYASSGNYWLNGYGWDSANRIGNSDIDGDKTKYGNEYGLLVRLFVGGDWSRGSACGSRSVAGARLSASRLGYCAGRGASEPWVG